MIPSVRILKISINVTLSTVRNWHNLVTFINLRLTQFPTDFYAKFTKTIGFDYPSLSSILKQPSLVFLFKRSMMQNKSQLFEPIQDLRN